ncbi:MAG: FtsX-like permease family protein [Caldilineaceae bacterium]
MLSSIYTNISIGLLVLVGLILLVLLALAFANPVLAKLGVRNIPRRPAQSILIVIGLTLSTIIFITSLSLGDTLNYSIQRHAIDAFGTIDQIIAPPLLSIFTDLRATAPQDPGTSNSPDQPPDPLANDSFDSILALIDQGLPGIPMARYDQLKAELVKEPLVDGAAPSILFPTIIRDTNSGQGEPLGFIMAVDDSYTSEFGLHNQDGETVKTSSLRQGVGNIFELTASLFQGINQQTQQLGIGQIKISDLIRLFNSIGTVASTPLTDTAAIVNAADQLGLGRLISNTTGISNTSLLSLTQQLGITDTTLSGIAQTLGISDTTIAGVAQQFGVPASQLQQLMQQFGLTDTTTLSQTNALPLLALLGAGGIASGLLSNNDVAPNGEVTGTLGNLFGLSGDSNSLSGVAILNSLNLNTAGQRIDNYLGQYGLQLRQGELYLNQLGADKLSARVGDTLEIFIGPIPLPYRVKGIIAESGPAGALTPVVLMRLDEAQRLLFMEGKVNNVLISQKGDILEGMQYTSQVAARLRVLALNDEQVTKLADLLRDPAAQSALESEIERLKREGIVSAEDEVPEFLRGIINSFAGSGVLASDMETLKSELAKPGVTPALREVLSKDGIRSALAELDLPAQLSSDISTASAKLSDLMVIEPLSKNTVVTAADVTGGVFSSVFSLFGIFSILAGILLIFLIYVMMAAERRGEMGMARAIGVQRGHLVRMFVTEGMIYDLLAAALGVLLGLLVAWLMVGWVSGLFNSIGEQFGTRFTIFRFRFHIVPTSVIIAYSLGVLLTFLVVTYSSWRVSRLNIATAIRDLPNEATARPRSLLNRIWRWLVGPLLMGAGGYLVYRGLSGAQTYFQLGGTLLLWGLSILLARSLEQTRMRNETAMRISYSLLGIGLVIVWGVPWNQLQGRSAFTVLINEQGWLLASFALQAPMLILGAIITVMFNADSLLNGVMSLFGRIGSVTPALKMAIAYPLSARFRTAMAMVMFSMIVATVVIMAVVIQATQTIVVQDEKDTGGFEIYTSNGLLSFFDPIIDLQESINRADKEQYPQLDQIEAVGGVVEQGAEARQSGADTTFRELRLTGVTDGYAQQAADVYPFKARAAGFASDAEVWEALRTRDDVAIITEDLLKRNENGWRRFSISGVDENSSQLPEITMEIRTTDGGTVSQRLQVIGLLEDKTTRAGGDIQVNLQALDKITGQSLRPSTYYIKVKPGADAHAVANEVEKAFLSSSLDATVASEAFAQGQAITRGILRLFQGFMALGLLVGIAALGVISSRSVVERRQQVGMLRAVGFQARLVAFTFLIESSFIALTGIVIGALTGWLMGENIVRTLFTDLTPETTFSTPWGQIVLILLLAYGFSLLTTILPALQASRIYPAEALRYE